MNPEQVVERERRLAMPVATATFVAAAIYVVSTIVQQTSGLDSGAKEAETLRFFHDHSSTFLVSSVLSAIAVGLWCFPLYYLFRAAQDRNPNVKAAMAAFAFIGPLLLAVQIILSWFATKHVSGEFIGQAAGAAHPNELAKNLTEDATIQKVAGPLVFPAVLGIAIAFIYIGLQCTRTGLLTRFSGTLGMALGASLFLIPQFVLIAIFAWLVFVGLIFINKVPGGSRPPAWDAGKAIPPEAPEAGSRGGLFGGRRPPPDEEQAEIETTAVETTGSDTSGAAAPNPPRESGERRKRKRRR